MAAGHTQTDVLSRVRREQRMRGKPSAFSGLRLVLAATAITVSLIFVAFGVIGVLLKARTPQEPVASRLDQNAPVVQQTETPQTAPEPEPAATSTHEKNPEPEDIEKKAVKTLRVIAPPVPVTEQNESVAQQPAPVPDPETTATIPPPQVQPKQQATPRAVQQRPQQRYTRRQVPDSQSDNPLLQLFGIKKYR